MSTASLDQYEALSQERKRLQELGHLPPWYITPGWQMAKEKYIVEGEDAILGRHRTIAKTLARHLKGREAEWEEKFFNLLWEGILSPASPALGNTGTTRGMVVSCSGQVVGDSVDDFYTSLRETALLSKWGFGTSADFSGVRPRGSSISRGGKANGAVEVIEDFFTAASKISQGGKRRGSVGAYLDIEHADWDEAVDSLSMNPNGKNYGWIVRDSFIEKLLAGDEEANRRFTKAIYVKLKTGKGYIFCVDKANRHRPQMYKDLGLDVVASNLCTEIMLHSSPELTYSCILASLNLLHWDKIKNSDAAFVAHVFLDCLCSEFIEKSEGIPGLEKVREFTIRGRAVGLGVMGFHTYLQYQRIPYISLQAQFLSSEIAKHMHDETLRASQWLAQEYGEPEWCKGYGVRNTHRTASAPTKSTALLMGGVSESWFPDPGMVFDSESAVGGLRRIPPALYELMVERGVYSPETVQDIIEHLGSVQHVSWLDDEEKLVFLNAFEMDQRILLRHASQRQRWICQGQSLNFYVPEDGSEDLVAELMTRVLLDPNILSQYYIYSRSGVVVRDECLACAA
ncbi:ribonucleotide reductase [Pseudomonas phage vB_PaeS_PAO1_Ab18]|uniref:Ribonucleoside-diphosphate reductase n=1 Tax=Pseudomonas phage vB_PaeS_PAO1_Ab18 TaxID=1548905 RepID=A0A0A1IV43_9CAUD|nr:ribonucleotide reductase [Pseudomonas phage vB_PaeS_PAO1_Ab18]CEF89646.1 putative Ribonucleotide reductase of class Ia [Pseudomonas phage vB_PaeS_PAO1_Ab18]